VLCKPNDQAQVASFPHLGGLHHDYEWSGNPTDATPPRDDLNGFFQ
jgi:hypothetical protein